MQKQLWIVFASDFVIFTKILNNKTTMTIFIKPNMTQPEIDKEMEKLLPVKKLDANKYFGKLKWGENPLEYQKKLRNEWN
jgi:hypothetical protein